MLSAVATLPGMPRKQLPESEKKIGLSAKVDPSLVRSLQEAADADDRTLSYMVEKAIRTFLESLHGKRGKGRS